MSRKIFFLCVYTILMIFFLNVSTRGDDLPSKIGIQKIKVRKLAPNFFLKDLNGRKVELKSFKGKVVFINFWATWCGSCKDEMPSMESLWQQFKGKGFVLLSISVDYEGSKPVKEFIKKYHYTFPVLLDPKCKILDLYKIERIPTTILIDKKGIMIGKVIGPRNWKSPEVIFLLDGLTEK